MVIILQCVYLEIFINFKNYFVILDNRNKTTLICSNGTKLISKLSIVANDRNTSN